MAGFQWGTALGAGAKSALSTYEALEDIEQQRADSARRDRALKIQEDANTRAQQSHARQERAAAKAEADAERLRSIYAGGDEKTQGSALRLPDGTGDAGGAAPTRTQARLRDAQPAEGAAQDQPPRQEIGGAPEPRGRGLGDLQERLVRGGFIKEAREVGLLRNAEAERQLTHVRTAGEMTKLKDAEISLAQRQLGQYIARAGQIVEQLPGDDNVPLATGADSPARAVIDQMVEGYELLPDGRKMSVTYNDDGSASVEFTDRNTGEVVGGQKITTQGQLRQFVRMSSAFSDPVTYNQYITRAETSRRERELHEVELADKKATGALNAEKARNARAERIHLDRFNELLKNPSKNEDELRYLADVLATHNPKLLDTKKVTDPATGVEQEVQYNKLAERIDAMVPLETVEVPNSKGEPAQFSTEQATQRYIAALPEALQAAGGNANAVLAQLRNEHDKMFRRGAFDKYVMPTLMPRVRALMQQAQQAQAAAQSGAKEGIKTQDRPVFRPGSVLDRMFPGEKPTPQPQEFSARRAADAARESRISRGQ